MAKIVLLDDGFIRRTSIEIAKGSVKEFGIKPGDLVAHPSSKYVYRLVDVVGRAMLVERPVNVDDQNGPKIRETLPLEGAMDVEMLLSTVRYGVDFCEQKRKLK